MEYMSIKINGEFKDVILVRSIIRTHDDVVAKLFLEEKNFYWDNNYINYKYWIYNVKKDTFYESDYEEATAYFGELRYLIKHDAIPDKYRNVDLYERLKKSGQLKYFCIWCGSLLDENEKCKCEL